MTISYPLTPPAALLKIAQASLRYRVVVGVSKSPSTLVGQAQRQPGACWILDVSLPKMSREENAPVVAFLLSLDGPWGNFTFPAPLGGTPLGVPSGTPVTDGTNAKGSRTLATRGWTASAPDVLKAGDYIQVGTRLYGVLTDASADGSGDATLDIRPPLREAPADGTTIITSGCVGVFRLASNEYPLFSADMEKLPLSGFSAVEDI